MLRKIVIIEDKLARALSLAVQLGNYGLEVMEICYFCPDAEKFKADMEQFEACKSREGCPAVPITRGTLANFRELMDRYYGNKDTIIITDFHLEGDAECSIMERVNIRNIRKENRHESGRVFMYTGLGAEVEKTLETVVGKEHMLPVMDMDDNLLRLDFNTPAFQGALVYRETGRPYTAQDAAREIQEYLKAHLPNFELTCVCRKSTHPKDSRLFMAAARHMENGTYAVWTCWNGSTKSLNHGHYMLKSHKSCMELMHAYMP